MNQPNLLELARQGDPKAIAALMNAALEPKGITAKASLENHCLSVFLESAKTLNQVTLITFIRRGLLELDTESIETVKVGSQKLGESSFSWMQEFAVHPEIQSAPIFSEKTNGEETYREKTYREETYREKTDKKETYEEAVDFGNEIDDRLPTSAYLKAYLLPTF